MAEQLDEARLQRRQPHEHDHEPEHERDGEADREEVERGRRAAHHAESEIHDEERRDAGQRHGERAREDLRAPRDDRPQALIAEPHLTDGQRAEAIDEHFDEREMAVEREEREHDEQRVELAERRRAGAAHRVDVEGERQAHAVGEQLAAHRHAVEQNLQCEADRHPDDDLLDRDDDACCGERRDAYRARHHRRNEQRNRTGQHDSQAPGHEQRTERRRHHEAGGDTHERPEELADPCFELACGERDHVRARRRWGGCRQLMSIGMLWNSSRV